MRVLETLSIVTALLLASVAALVSGDPQARQEVASFVAEALKPQAADLSGDPGYLEGTGTDWLLPPPSNAVVPQERQTAQLTD